MKEETYHLGVKAIIRNEKGKILLLKVNLKQLTHTKIAYWDIPGGRVQVGGAVEDTLKRELLEETGITTVNAISPFSMVLSNIRIPVDSGAVGLILASYMCEVEDSTQIKLSEEHIEYGWFTPKEAAKLLSVKYPSEFLQKLATI